MNDLMAREREFQNQVALYVHHHPAVVIVGISAVAMTALMGFAAIHSASRRRRAERELVKG